MLSCALHTSCLSLRRFVVLLEVPAQRSISQNHIVTEYIERNLDLSALEEFRVLRRGHCRMEESEPEETDWVLFYVIPTMQRSSVLPTLTYLPRSSLHASTHTKIDTALKQLKSHSRRLKACIEAYETELSLLRRLYYKGKNQHRAAVFWRRVDEIRRYGERICGSSVHSTSQSLQYSFFGPDISTQYAGIIAMLWSPLIKSARR